MTKGQVSQYFKYGFAVAGQAALGCFVLIVILGIFKFSILGRYTLAVALICWALVGVTFFLKCHSCRRSYFFDPDRYRGGFSIVPGYNGFRKLGPVCRNCGLPRLP